ncbi:9-O-acetylesterase [Brevundimonas intermedia]|uniref:9-O-acetylesterase n=1 Tax=Brevundimonas intermedia TaxID=74315 RepID=A0ABQ5TC70_9CAUL|nr:sialate O-acetylesterase [Brevundimonas intermedia]GLK50012.1 9-O-acetylesterase [Brevundimonas intermedia]
MRKVRLCAAASAILAGLGGGSVASATPNVQSEGQGQVASPGQARPLMASLFTDHGVLQRDHPISVWGQASPGVAVEVSLGALKTHGQAGPDGSWRALLPSAPAGGPYVLSAKSSDGAVQALQDVMVGDVYLCSGQSNMEQPVRYAQRAWDPVAGDKDKIIRLLTVTKDRAPAPLDALAHPVRWTPATPQTVEEFSAVCFFFGQAVREAEGVPVGLIADSWGGSSIQAWIDSDHLRRLGGNEAALDALTVYARDRREGVQLWSRVWQDWWTQASGDRPWLERGGDWIPVPAMTPWEQWGVPSLAAFDGMVWYRLDFELTSAQARSGAAAISLGMVDQINLTWLNGQIIGVGEAGNQTYAIPAGVLKPGRNQLMINVLDSWGDGGVFGSADTRVLRLGDGAEVALDGFGWRYRPVDAGVGQPPRAPWEALFGLSTLSNAMIAPLHDYGLRGVLWYQGESNVGYGQDRYQDYLAELIADWRARFGRADLPFLVAQLADFGALPDEGGPSGWAEIRDAQRRAVEADANAGMAVTIDLGDRHDIHPAQKREVGRRLAQAAQAVIYRDADASRGSKAGPAAETAVRVGDRLQIRLRDALGLRSVGSDQAIGLELCNADESDCRYAQGRVTGDALMIAGLGSSDAVVRYGWDDAPVLNLFNAAGLPLGPFRLSIHAE